jgi:hypothetical protein
MDKPKKRNQTLRETDKLAVLSLLLAIKNFAIHLET